MGALRKLPDRSVDIGQRAQPGVPAQEVCVFVPDQPQYRPPTGDDDDSGGSGCFFVPLAIHCEYRIVAGGRHSEVCFPVGGYEVCT
jgi:hypothetical protein